MVKNIVSCYFLARDVKHTKGISIRTRAGTGKPAVLYDVTHYAISQNEKRYSMISKFIYVSVLVALFTSVAEAKPQGKITMLDAKWEKDDAGQRVCTIRVEAQRVDRNARQIIKLAVQVKDSGGTNRFATVTSRGGSTWTRGGSPIITSIWTFKVKPGDLKNPRLTYEAILIDETSNDVLDSRVHGIPKRDVWDKENEKAEKLDVKQFYNQESHGSGI